MAQRDSLPIPPPTRRPQSVDTELQQRLNAQREEDAARNAQNQNETEFEKERKKMNEEYSEREEKISTGLREVRKKSYKAIKYGRMALYFGNVGIQLTTNLLSLVTIIGPIIGILCLIFSAFFGLKTSWEINRIVKQHAEIPRDRIKKEIKKQILSAKNLIFSSCGGCASTAVAGILVMFLAFVPVIIIYELIKNIPAATGNAVAGSAQATFDEQNKKVEAAKKAQAEQKAKEAAAQKDKEKPQQ